MKLGEGIGVIEHVLKIPLKVKFNEAPVILLFDTYMQNWIHNKKFTLLVEAALCSLAYIVTRQLEAVTLLLAIFIILEITYASYCYDRLSHNVASALQYSCCYGGKKGQVRKPTLTTAQSNSEINSEGLREPRMRVDHEGIMKELALKEHDIYDYTE